MGVRFTWVKRVMDYIRLRTKFDCCNDCHKCSFASSFDIFEAIRNSVFLSFVTCLNSSYVKA